MAPLQLPRALRKLALCLLTIVAPWCSGAHAAAAYPEKPITFVIPFSAGSETDILARLLITHLQAHFPEASIVAENHAGDSGTKAAAEVHLAPADGYTLLFGRLTTQALAPALKHDLSYGYKDFSFLGLADIEPLICAVPTSAPFKDARALLQAMRAAPGKFKYGHTGTESVTNLTALYFFKLGGLKPDTVTAVKAGNASADAIKAVADGTIDLACTPAGSMLEPIRSGKVKPLFSTSPGRIPELPDLHNARESGFSDLDNLVGGSVLVGPIGMPAPVIARWRAVLASLAKDPDWNAAIARRGAIQTLGSSKDNEGYIKEQYNFYSRLVLSLRLHP